MDLVSFIPAPDDRTIGDRYAQRIVIDLDPEFKTEIYVALAALVAAQRIQTTTK